MSVNRLAEGLWRWSAPHPEWREDADWDRVVWCVYAETSAAIVLIDPLVPAGGDGDRFWRALDRDVARLGLPVEVLLTCRWHVRSAAEVAARLGSRVWAPALDGHDLAGVATDLADGSVVGGVTAVATGLPPPQEEVLYWIAERRALVAGDVLLGDAAGGLRVAPPSWYDGSAAEREWYRGGLPEVLRAAAALDPAVILPAHGVPVTDAAAAALNRAVDGMRAV